MPRFWGIHHATGIEKFHSLNCLLLFRFDSKRLVFVKEQEHSNQTCCSTHLEVKTFVKTPLVNESGHFFSFKKKKKSGLVFTPAYIKSGPRLAIYHHAYGKSSTDRPRLSRTRTLLVCK